MNARGPQSCHLATEQLLQAPEKREPVCEKCGSTLDWRECCNCGGEGYSDHDCGEDCCCCLNPEPNVTCDICEGERAWRQCRMCYTGDDWDG